MEKATAAMLDAARARLVGLPQAGLGEERTTRWRGTRIIPVGTAWHIGALLLSVDRVLATAEVLRAAEHVRRGYAAESARERAGRREQARRGGFTEGEVVHVGWSEIDVTAVDAGVASGPLALIEGVPSIAWVPGGDYMPLKVYLDDRLDLLGC